MYVIMTLQMIARLDECGVWGGDGVDFDQDGICDDIDECIPGHDYKVCNGEGYDCGGSCNENVELQG